MVTSGLANMTGQSASTPVIASKRYEMYKCYTDLHLPQPTQKYVHVAYKYSYRCICNFLKFVAPFTHTHTDGKWSLSYRRPHFQWLQRTLWARPRTDHGEV